MRNNYWEELDMNTEILDFHEEALGEVGVPEWMSEINCPFCKKDLPLRSIYGIGIKLNTRNMGDLTVEILCDECRQMDTLYFRKEISKLVDILPLLSGDKQPSSEPVLEEDMYKMKYNNVVEKLVETRQEGQ